MDPGGSGLPAKGPGERGEQCARPVGSRGPPGRGDVGSWGEASNPESPGGAVLAQQLGLYVLCMHVHTCTCAFAHLGELSAVTGEFRPAWVVGILVNPGRKAEGLGTEIQLIQMKDFRICTRTQDSCKLDLSSLRQHEEGILESWRPWQPGAGEDSAPDRPRPSTSSTDRNGKK